MPPYFKYLPADVRRRCQDRRYQLNQHSLPVGRTPLGEGNLKKEKGKSDSGAIQELSEQATVGIRVWFPIACTAWNSPAEALGRQHGDD